MKVAVVGSGVSGLAATWLLNEHSDSEVHLYEADARPGGHANTVRFNPPGRDTSVGVDVDTGFIVLNPKTYPNFLRFLELYPNIKIEETEMTFSVSRDGGLFEWAGSNLMTVFCQPSRILDPNMWRLIYDVLRFNACARRLVIGFDKGDVQGYEFSIGDYLDREGYSKSFRHNYLIPMTAAIWSTPPDKCVMDFPARTLIQFLNNHHLLQITGKPSWLTIKGGSHKYVNQILSKLPASQLHLSTPVVSLSADVCKNGVHLTIANGETVPYDHVVLACHSDTSLSILKEGQGLTPKEEKILGRFQWSKNEAILHSDVKLMPRSRLAWSCWNYLTSTVVDAKGQRKANADQVALTYGMNDLQHISEEQYGPVLVTLNAPFQPQEDTIVGRYQYDHPVLDTQAVLSQTEMGTIQNARHISYAGAYLNYGFHEDGFTSGLDAVLKHSTIPNVRAPFDVKYADREPNAVRIALFFDLFEQSGARVLVGAYLGLLLAFVRAVLSRLGVDLSHIDAEMEDTYKAKEL